MENDSGWLNPDAPSNKRQKLSHHILPRDKNQSGAGSTSRSPSTEVRKSRPVAGVSLAPEFSHSQPEAGKRQDCRYSSTCYRRNENHLLQFRHRMLEEAYRLMSEANDFSKFPETMSVDDDTASTLLDQANILKDAGFQIETHGAVKSKTANEDNSSVELKEKTESVSSASAGQPSGSSKSSNPWKDSIASVFEERRRLYRETKNQAQQAVVQGKESGTVSKESERQDAFKTRESMEEKWKSSCPYNIFLTKVRSIQTEKDGVLSAGFVDLFDASLGEVKAVCHINFMVEAGWLFDRTREAGLDGIPTRIIYGEENTQLVAESKYFPWLKLFCVKSPFPFGHHHTKMTFVQYTDNSVRFMIYTANLVESDWDNRTQGIWISPRCPKVPSGSLKSVGESPTNFRGDILQYLSTYPVAATAAWRDVIQCTDCSEIRVFFIGSAPITSQSSSNGFQFGIKKVEKVLKSFEMESEPDWKLVIQCSSIGTLGKSADDWLINELGAAMAGKDRCIRGPINVIFPSHQNVKDSFDGILGGGCLPYSATTHMKQKWLGRHFYQWKASCTDRSRAPPHIKSYLRCSPDYTKIAWFLLTSANLSKAAWGKLSKNGDRLSVMSWEAGVLFIPEILVSSTYFTPKSQPITGDVVQSIPLYYDMPPTKYDKNDSPWFFERLQLMFSEDSD